MSTTKINTREHLQKVAVSTEWVYPAELESGVAVATDRRGKASVERIAGTAIATQHGAATTSENGVSVTRTCGSATAGWSGVAVAMDRGVATAGTFGVAVSMHLGAARAGDGGIAVGENVTTGQRGTSIVRSFAKCGRGRSGPGGTIIFLDDSVLDGAMVNTPIVLNVGKDGILPDTFYKMTRGGIVIDDDQADTAQEFVGDVGILGVKTTDLDTGEETFFKF